MPREFDNLIEREQDGCLSASMPAVWGCDTQARSQDELLGRIRVAISACLEEHGDEPERLGDVGIQRARVA